MPFPSPLTDTCRKRPVPRDRAHAAVQLENMAKKMLIDATHAEETRVVVVDGNKVEEFDFESENKRQLAGNIYLAKVTRVEPSLLWITAETVTVFWPSRKSTRITTRSPSPTVRR